MNRNIKLLEQAYFAILVTIFLLIVFTPYIIRSGFTLLDEEIAEVAAIALLFTVGYVILFLYRKEAVKNRNELNRLKQDKGVLENRLSEAFNYIGTVNIQIEEIMSVFSDIRKFPENKKDFRYILQFLADRTLSMVNADWVLFRIIDTQNLEPLVSIVKRVGTLSCPITKSATGTLPQMRNLEGSRLWGRDRKISTSRHSASSQRRSFPGIKRYLLEPSAINLRCCSLFLTQPTTKIVTSRMATYLHYDYSAKPRVGDIILPSGLPVNTSCGKVVDAGAVALREGRLGGVALDTFEGKRYGLKKNFINGMIWRSSR